MSKMDAERFSDRIKLLLEDNISAKLTEITNDFAAEDAAAGRTITLEDIPSDGYFLNTSSTSPNINPFVIIVLDNVSVSSAGSSAARNYNFVIIFCHSGMKNESSDNIQRKLLRYTRAIEEVYLEKFDQLGGYSKIKLNGTEYNQEHDTKRGQIIRVSGISFTATIA